MSTHGGNDMEISTVIRALNSVGESIGDDICFLNTYSI